MNTQERITSLKQALELLNNNILISKPYGSPSSLYIKQGDMILVLNTNKRYFITLSQFQEDFLLGDFYIFQNGEETEIDQEHKNLRQ